MEAAAPNLMSAVLRAVNSVLPANHALERRKGSEIEGLGSVGVTAGASAPEALVEEVINAFRDRFDVKLETVTTALERIAFNVPRELRPNSAA